MQPALLLSICSLASTSLAAAQESLAILDAPLVVVPATQRIHLLLDWNGDGLQDFAVLEGAVGSRGVRAYLNDGRGGLVGVVGGGGGGELWRSHMETYDADGDGRDDLVWVEPRESSFPGFMKVLTFRDNRLEHVPHLEHDTAIDIGTLLDADRDGDADRVRVLLSTLTLELFEQGATGAWKAESTLALSLGFQPTVIVKLDHDGDGTTDLYLQDTWQGAFVSLAGGSLHPPVTFSHGMTYFASGTWNPPYAIPGDIDGDGDEDLTFFDAQSYKVNRRTGPASWVLEARRTGGTAARFADVDGDGDLDGVCCSSGYGEPQPFFFRYPSTFRVSLNDGTGGFAPAFTIPGLGSLKIAGAADLDRDGDVDLAAGQCIYFARGPLTHPPQRRLARAQSTRARSSSEGRATWKARPGSSPT
jgi:hypothetical protein